MSDEPSPSPNSSATPHTEVHEDPLALPMSARVERYVLTPEAEGAAPVTIEERALVGSAEGADVQVSDATVSRMHADLEPREDGLWVRDLGSRNGTFVDEVRVAHGRALPGQRLRLGGASFAVSGADARRADLLYPSERYGPLLGRSDAMRELFGRLARVAATDSTVLVHGETGTGKELAASALHDASARAEGPYVVVDCASLPESLLESELFGHARGAFTDARRDRIGAFEAADGGTLFLDEIGELPLAMQPALLRALESRQIRRVGETRTRPVDVRVIAATHRDLRAMVNDGGFREDLYFRLAVIPLTMPPLRERPQDIPLLVERFIPDGQHLPPGTVEELTRRSWPGNVRELRNWVERIVALGVEDVLGLGDGARSLTEPLPAVDLDEPFKAQKERWLHHLEREYVRGMLDRHHGEVAGAAEAAGLDKSYVHRLVRKHGL